jgi:hypothetical protein
MKCVRLLLPLAIASFVGGCSRDDASPDPSSRTVVAYPIGGSPTDSAACLISDSAVGPLRLGMTVGLAEAVWPAAKFSRTSDGEGVALIEVKAAGETLMTIYAGEDDPEPAHDRRRRIEHIEVFSPSCSTAQGIKPGMLINDAERILGKVSAISKSEIESREFVEFANQPERLTIRLDYTGIFGADSAETTRFAPEAKILSIAIASRG